MQTNKHRSGKKQPVRKGLAARHLYGRSKISNGSKLLPGIDGRSAEARRYRDLVTSYNAASGHRNEALCRQLASLTLHRENLDSAILRGENVDSFTFVRLANSITRIITKLGLGSVEPQVENLRREREDREALLK